MARFSEPTHEQVATWRQWVAERPPAVRAVAERFDPWTVYRMKESGHRCTVYSFVETEDGVMLTVNVTGDLNRLAFERRVFGVPPDNLEECELPAPGELVGAAVQGVEETERLITYLSFAAGEDDE